MDGDSSGVGVGDVFLRFDLLFGVGDGVGEAFFDFGEAVGVGVGVVFFFRCLRDELGVGSGSKAFLIFVPDDSWAEGAASTAPNKITRIRNHFITRRCSVRCPQRRFESSGSAGYAARSAPNAIATAKNHLTTVLNAISFYRAFL